MSVTPETRRWDALAAARTKGDVGDGIASVLALLGKPEVISFAGGFPDPETFPRERVATLVQEFLAEGEVSAFQYAPTRGLAGTLDAFAGRLEALQGRRPDDDELVVTSGAIEALELVGESFLDHRRHRRRRGSDVSRRDPGVPGFEASSSPCRSTSTGSTSTSWRGASRPACARSSSTRSPTTRIPPA